MSNRPVPRAAGFSLLELLTAMSIFLIICGVAFAMLMVSMRRYQAESQLLSTFQEARFGLDQIVRDVNSAGFPSRNQFAASYSPSFSKYAVSPFAWLPGYPSTPCPLGGGGGGPGCTTPGSFDLIIETNIDPKPWGTSDNGVEWVRYELGGTTLFRGVVNKAASGTNDANVATSDSDVLVPYIQNVMNNPNPAELADLQAAYPAMFSSGAVPIFRYWCDSAIGSASPPLECTSSNVPSQIQSVSITLIIMAPYRDIHTNRPIVVELKGRGRRINPAL
jgi:prepilin-type N-terminal cleavage/methylation domain-containing protein